MVKMAIIYPQWQGGADAGTYRGARELEELYLEDVDFEKVPVATDDDLQKKFGIVGFDALARQMTKAAGILENAAPDTLFCLGGGCDADVPAIAYLNERYRGDLAVLWLDAHGDLNTPQESATALFYGMPLRAAMDPACFGLMPIARPLTAGY